MLRAARGLHEGQHAFRVPTIYFQACRTNQAHELRLQILLISSHGYAGERGLRELLHVVVKRICTEQ